MKCDFPRGESTCKRCKSGGHVCIVKGRKPRTAPKTLHTGTRMSILQCLSSMTLVTGMMQNTIRALAEHPKFRESPSAARWDRRLYDKMDTGARECQDPIVILTRSAELRSEIINICESLQISSVDFGQTLRQDQADVSHMLETILNSEVEKQNVYALRGNDAEHFLDLIESVLDDPDSTTLSLRASRLLIRLSEKSGILPRSVRIRGVALNGQHPLCGGGFADIYRGSYQGKHVAVKRLRVFPQSFDYKKIHRV